MYICPPARFTSNHILCRHFASKVLPVLISMLIVAHVHRSLDLPLHHRNKRQFVHPLAIIRGRYEPKTMDAFLQRLIADCQECGQKVMISANLQTHVLYITPIWACMRLSLLAAGSMEHGSPWTEQNPVVLSVTMLCTMQLDSTGIYIRCLLCRRTDGE